MAGIDFFKNMSFDDFPGVTIESKEFQSNGGAGVIIIRADDYGDSLIQIMAASNSDPDKRFSVLNNGTFSSDATVKLDYIPVDIMLKVKIADATPELDNLYVKLTQ